ncbi:hypothetical protein [Carboxylicivirga sp. RSCT41]|uniref:hypothetical protein n=1 Tax=Carboxylicivirga agarovorans TaxID=3417570 RepID=UPI003D32C14D
MMKKNVCTILILIIALASCTEETILPETGNVMLIDEQLEFENQEYYIVSEIHYLLSDDPYWFRSDDYALVTGTIKDTETEITDLNAGNYYIIFPIERKSKIFQVKAGHTIECTL